MSGEISSVVKQLPNHYSGKYVGSFAYLTIKDRLPVILVKVIDSLCRNRNEVIASYGETVVEEIKEVIGRLSGLQNEVATNKLMKPICDDFDDAALWNEYLENQKELYNFPPAWFDSSWLYSECYFYRRMKQAFLLSSALKEYDPFHKQKKESFFSTMEAVLFLCSALNETLTELKNCNSESEKFNFFRRYLEASLWGNKWDLSLSAGKENIIQSNPLSELEELREKIVVNQTEEVYKILVNSNKYKKNVTINFILDNAGFELFCDLCFMRFLLDSKLVNKINIHPKVLPWFVSDTLEKDIHWLLQNLSESNHKNLVEFSDYCASKLQSGEWIIVNETFWTLPHDYSEMCSVNPQLYQRLAESNLIIFKGDLNYRKLMGDRQWEETATFEEALNGFLPGPLVALRTIKSNVLVGMRTDTSETLSKLSTNWKFSGNYAVIQCYTT